MPCPINNGLTTENCTSLIGGLKTIYLANKDQVLGFTDTDMDNIYDSVQMATQSGTASVFYKFEVTKNTSSHTQTSTPPNNFILQNLDFFVGRSDQEAYDVAKGLVLGEFVAIIENRMGKKIILGELNGLSSTAVVIQSGVASTDSAAIHVTLEGEELEFAHEFIGVIPV